MFSKRHLFVPVAIILATFLGVSAADAQSSCPYTLASLQGSYAVVVTYGANVAIAFATRQYDGNGAFTSTFLINAPTTGSTTGERNLITGTQKGTYTVNCNGTGVNSRILAPTNGVTSLGFDDFIITGAAQVFNGSWSEPRLIATTVVDAQRTPAALIPGGIFAYRTMTRLPN